MKELTDLCLRPPPEEPRGDFVLVPALPVPTVVDDADFCRDREKLLLKVMFNLYNSRLQKYFSKGAVGKNPCVTGVPIIIILCIRTLHDHHIMTLEYSATYVLHKTKQQRRTMMRARRGVERGSFEQYTCHSPEQTGGH